VTAHVFLERTFEDPLTPEDVFVLGRESAWCFDLHRVRWHGSFLSNDGHAMVCRFSAPDLESARLAMRDGNIDLSRFWSGTVIEGERAGTPNVVVERSFASPVRFEDIAALERAKAWCLEAHRVTYLRSYMSLDGKRMLCFYEAPDAEAVRIAQREADMPVAGVWAGAPVTPEAA
jgi:hypothetical protein